MTTTASPANYQVELNTTNGVLFQADSLPLAEADPNGRPGWTYTKTAGDGAADKMNWYIYYGIFESMKIKDLESMFFIGSIDTWTNTQGNLPFFTIYTKMTGDNDQGAYYHSKHHFQCHINSQLIRNGEKCLFYALQSPHDHVNSSGLRSIPFKTRLDTGTWNVNNEILYMVVQTTSSALDKNIYFENLGCTMHPFGGIVGKSKIDIALVQ